MTSAMWIIDAFTPVAFRGNAAAVCLMDSFPEESVMQLIALRNNLSETAFLVKISPLHYHLRWFTPEAEVKLCGHATLAATHMLHQMGKARTGDTITYESLSGVLTAVVHEKSITLDFPALPGTMTRPPGALKALGVLIENCEKNDSMYLVEVKDFISLVACAPDFKKLAKLDCVGVIVTTAAGVSGYDFASRFFAPRVGVDEDPVTGSAHCMLAPYWAKKLGKKTFHCFQASKGQGVLDVTLENGRALISGQCVTTLRGELTLPKPKKDKVA